MLKKCKDFNLFFISNFSSIANVNNFHLEIISILFHVVWNQRNSNWNAKYVIEQHNASKLKANEKKTTVATRNAEQSTADWVKKKKHYWKSWSDWILAIVDSTLNFLKKKNRQKHQQRPPNCLSKLETKRQFKRCKVLIARFVCIYRSWKTHKTKC